MKVLKNADLSGKQIFGKKNCKAWRQKLRLHNPLNFVEWFLLPKTYRWLFQKVLSTLPFNRNGFLRKNMDLSRTWWLTMQPSLLRSPAHDQLQQASLGVDLPTFFGIFFFLLKIRWLARWLFPNLDACRVDFGASWLDASTRQIFMRRRWCGVWFEHLLFQWKMTRAFSLWLAEM